MLTAGSVTAHNRYKIGSTKKAAAQYLSGGRQLYAVFNLLPIIFNGILDDITLSTVIYMKSVDIFISHLPIWDVSLPPGELRQSSSPWG